MTSPTEPTSPNQEREGARTMTNPSDLQSLLERVEGAEGASAELDALIIAAIAAPSGSFVEQSRINSAWCIYTAPHRLWDQRGVWWRPEGWPVTASLDAALALVERLGWRAYSADASIPARWSWMLESDARDSADCPEYATGASKTPALALLAALLRALLSQCQGEKK